MSMPVDEEFPFEESNLRKQLDRQRFTRAKMFIGILFQIMKD